MDIWTCIAILAPIFVALATVNEAVSKVQHRKIAEAYYKYWTARNETNPNRGPKSPSQLHEFYRNGGREES